MTTPHEDQIQSIWRSQPILTVSMTTEQLRARAAQFETETRRRNRIDFVSFAMVALITGIGAVTLQNPLTRIGALLLAVWAAIGLYAVRALHGLKTQPSSASGANSCAAWHQLQLERQRDVALSRPWGIALGLPGVVLILIGYVDSGMPWTVSVILAGLGLFLGIGAVIHGKILAGRWQQEIDSLQALKAE